MGLLDAILSGQGGDIVGQLSRNFNLDRGATESAVSNVIPAISRGLRKNASDGAGLESLLGALGRGQHERYVDDPDSLSNQSTVDDGNSILGHVFGSKDVSRNVAAHAAQQSGLDSGMLKKMLPVLASVAMGMMKKQGASAGLGALLGGGGGGRSQAGSALTSFLDADNDGSVTDDLFNMAKKFF